MAVRVVQVQVESVDLEAIDSYLKLGPVRPKRKFQNDDLDLDGYNEIKESVDSTYLTIADTSYEYEGLIPSGIVNNNPSFESPVEIDDLVLSPRDGLIIVQTKHRNKVKPKTIFTLKVDESYQIAAIAEMKIIKNVRLRNTSFLEIRYPKLKLQIINNNEIKMSINYQIEIIESLDLNFKMSDIQLKSLKELIPFTANLQTKNIDTIITPKLFYDTITEKTKSYTKPSKPPLVSELDTELLKFQGTTVNWLLTRENCRYDEETRTVKDNPFWDKSMTSDQEVQFALDKLSFGFKLIKLPFYKEEVWYNQYTQNICSKSKAIQYLSKPHRIGGTGLLAEEMGLGKTVETVALALLNQRPFDELNKDFFNVDLQRSITRIKSTLIVCPESILHQWNDEIELHAPSLTVMIYKGLAKSIPKSSSELAKEMSEHDIILTSYSTISREIHNALYNPTLRPKRQKKNPISQAAIDIDLKLANFDDPEALETFKQINEEIAFNQQMFRDREDHSSPLVMVEFWRLILDEVQMVGGTLSNVCKIATRIPRFHSWGVSGTPIKNNVGDLNSLLSFLQIRPFGNSKTWSNLIENPLDFIKLFSELSLRHTKEMVKDDIHIPPQQKYLLSVPFGPVEQNNYEELYKQFLREVGLDADGNPIVEDWEPSPSYYEYMSFWLKKLRRICCHANIGTDNDVREKPGLQTMDKVLKSMIETSYDRIIQVEKDITLCHLEIGQIKEFIKKPKDALKVWENELPHVLNRVEELRQSPDLERQALLIRYSLDLLHRLYFFIASAHYQLYNPPITELVPGIDKDNMPEGVDPQLGGDEHVSSEIIVYRVLNKEENDHQELEKQFYEKAQNVRRELLSEPIKNVSLSVEKLNQSFHLNFIDYKPSGFQSMEPQIFSTKVGAVIAQLNSQAKTLNEWIKGVTKAISTPLLDGVTDPDGEEYGGSLQDQEKAAAYLDVLQRSIQDRNALVFGKTDSGEDFEKVDTIVETNSDFKDKLEEEYPKMLTQDSLRFLVIQSKAILADLKIVDDMSLFASLIVQVKKVFEDQKENMDATKKFFKNLNDCYNLRITYFRQLQELSDNVRPFDEYTHGNYDTVLNLEKLQKRIIDDKESLSVINSRIRYLKSLAIADAEENDKLCVVCRGVITIGSLTKCGHQYCKDCLDHWLARHSKCPICKQHITKIDVYNFTYNREEINVRMITSGENGVSHGTEDLFKVYHKLGQDDLVDINSLKIKNNYGAKVNTIVKQVLWIKKQNPMAQIVVYSQWTQLLQIIATAFKQNGILFLGSKNTLPRIGKGRASAMKSDIAQFKRDPRITCFLLNAKAEASGLTLVNAQHVFICEPFVNTALELQAISRIHRIGQKKPTFVWMFSISGSVEESIILLSTRKKLKEREKLDTEELTKNFSKLVEANGEHVDTSDLWNAHFSNKMDRIV